VYWTRALASGFTALPADFWNLFPDGALPSGSQYTPVADSQTVASVPPNQPHIFRFDFTAPEVQQDIGLLAVITSDNDPITASGTDVQQVVRSSKHTALKRVSLHASTGSIVLGVLILVGAAAAITTVAVTR
jgi:hypothetical protein